MKCLAITLTSRMLPRRPDLWIAWRERKLSCGCSKLGKLKLASRSIFEGWLARAAGSGIRSRSDEDKAQIQAEMVENSSRSAELRMKKLRNTNMQRVELVLAEIGSSWLNRRSSGVEPLQCLAFIHSTSGYTLLRLYADGFTENVWFRAHRL